MNEDNYNAWRNLFQDRIKTMQEKKDVAKAQKTAKEKEIEFLKTFLWWMNVIAVTFLTLILDYGEEPDIMEVVFIAMLTAGIYFIAGKRTWGLLENLLKVRLTGVLPPLPFWSKKNPPMAPSTVLLLLAIGVSCICEVCFAVAIICCVKGEVGCIAYFFALCLAIAPLVIRLFRLYRDEKTFHRLEYYVTDLRHL